MKISTRKILITSCVAAFFLLSTAVYLDSTDQKDPALSKLARRGQEAWRQHNCQSCHRLYGYGGFLGPDLTNAAKHLSEAQLNIMLTEGSGQMPAFHLPPKERKAIAAFLAAIDKTGRSLPSHNNMDSLPHMTSTALFKKVVKRSFIHQPLSKKASAGRDIVFAKGCINCHLPNRHSLRAPDLTQINKKFRQATILKALSDGIPGKMPAFRLSNKESKEVLAFLVSLNKNAKAIKKGFRARKTKKTFKNTTIPWFEYR